MEQAAFCGWPALLVSVQAVAQSRAGDAQPALLGVVKCMTLPVLAVRAAVQVRCVNALAKVMRIATACQQGDPAAALRNGLS